MEMDAVDKAYVDSIVPDGAIPMGVITVVAWSDAETGELLWAVHADVDLPISSSLGLLELAKLNLIARTPTGLPIRYPEDD